MRQEFGYGDLGRAFANMRVRLRCKATSVQQGLTAGVGPVASLACALCMRVAFAQAARYAAIQMHSLHAAYLCCRSTVECLPARQPRLPPWSASPGVRKAGRTWQQVRQHSTGISLDKCDSVLR